MTLLGAGLQHVAQLLVSHVWQNGQQAWVSRNVVQRVTMLCSAATYTCSLCVA